MQATIDYELDGITCEQNVEPIQEMYELQAQLEVLDAHHEQFRVGIIDPDQFGAELYSRKLITNMVLMDSKTVGIPISKIISMLLEGVKSNIGLDPTSTKCFANFMAFLKSHSSTTANIAGSIEHMLDDKVQELTTGGHNGRPTRSKRVCQLPLILERLAEAEDLPIHTPMANSLQSNETQMETSPEIEELNKLLAEDSDEEEQCSDGAHVDKALSMICPTGVLKKRYHSQVYTKLFKMAWNGKDKEAVTFVKRLRRKSSVAADLKVVCMEVVHTVNTERDLKMLLLALAYTDRAECENKHILKCRLHRRIAGLHYRNGDIEEANEHLVTALQLAKQMSPDIDSVYTFRLKALLLFEEYKTTGSEEARKGAELQFQLAMDQSRRQPNWKRLITERIKISKGKFHLDMIEIFRKHGKCEDTIEQLQYRARDTLNDVDETWLTEGDKAFFYTAYSQLMLEISELNDAEKYALQAFHINQECGFENRNQTTKEVLERIKSKKLSN